MELPVDGQGEGREPGDGPADLVSQGAEASSGQDVQVANDKRFEEKLVDVVGLYLNPPEKALVLSVDEETPAQ